MGVEHLLYYGLVDQRVEIEEDLKAGLLQPKRSMFYHRSYGAGVQEYENAPVGLSTEVALRYDVAAWVARRNLEVSIGSDGYRDRRAVTSQQALEVRRSGDSIDLMVPYIPMFDWQAPGAIQVGLGN